MKKIMLFVFLSCVTFSAINAQVPSLSKSLPKSFDVKGLTGSIMNVLGPSLSLTGKQSPGVTDAVSGFLGEKSKILPLQASDPTSYNSKFGSLFSGLKSKLGGILAADQMTKFMGLKPKTNDASNVLSNLFY